MPEQRRQPADWRIRQKALDPEHSFIVQAPAGSGKTELLIQRILVLLARARSPEEILAITFTRKAAGEMKARLVDALLAAGRDEPPVEPHARATWELARAVVTRDRTMGWHLAENASRLQVMTIDSFCAGLIRRMPWLSRFGAQPETMDDPTELYRQAAERLLSQVEARGPASAAARCLLAHLDTRLNVLRDMLVAMLGRRDQWLRHLLNRGSARAVLEESLKAYITTCLDDAHRALGAERREALVPLCRHAATFLPADTSEALSGLTDIQVFPVADLTDWPQWEALLCLLLTGQGQVRASVNRNQGFPPDGGGEQSMKARMVALLEDLAADSHAVATLQQLRKLPLPGYHDSQWQVLDALIQLLPLLVIELQKVFRETGRVDFIEVAGAARAALGDGASPEDLLLQLDSRICHILIDEFQDTSHGQYVLLQQLTAGWQPDDGRTLFVVGDPMQSIYRFREAEVGLYLRIRRLGLETVSLQSLTLSANFRSQEGLVKWVNRTFAPLFPVEPDENRGAVTYAPATAVQPVHAGEAVSLTAFAGRQDQAEARVVVDLVRQVQAGDSAETVAVLVRSRTHLEEIVRAFKDSGLRFQAQDVDPLLTRPVIQDLRALTRALLHPGDRVAWMAVLRAPWCGLTLDDLLLLCEEHPDNTVWDLLVMPGPPAGLFERFSDDSQARIDRFLNIMSPLVENKGRMALRRLVESAWLNLGGPACITESDLQDARQYFDLLEELDDGGDLERFELLDERLQKLYAAPDASAGSELQVMTVHKAKGLEFGTVILPGLGRRVSGVHKSLLRWQELPDDHLLLAPVPASASSSESRTYQAIGALMAEKDRLETLRVLYVAATRAKNRLHLLGHARVRADGSVGPEAGTFLDVLWPVLADEFNQNLQWPVEGVAEQDDCEVQPIRRLPLNWVPPEMQASIPALVEVVKRASSGPVETGAVLRPSLKSEEGRIVGQVIHRWLEQIALQGLDGWSPERVTGLRPVVKTQLVQHGLPENRLATCTERVVNALDRTLASRRGRWLLGSGDEAFCEYAVSGLVDKELVHATIDRTFVADGVRWIVDYKSTEPGTLALDEFYHQEAERYHAQLSAYAALFRTLEPGRPHRCALYFPMFDGWFEYP